ncbi:MAG: hypothetical protein RMJ97_02515, partial [Raineya sp.]|nr:hypothetical protein [Raineya sp.]
REFSPLEAAMINNIYIATDPDGSGPIVGFTNPGFTAGQNRFVIVKGIVSTGGTSPCPSCPADSPGAFRVLVEQMDAASDFLLLPTQQGLLTPANFANGLGVIDASSRPFPIPDWAVLDEQEVNFVRNATNSYNAKIRAVAEAKGLALVDADVLFNQIIRDRRIDGVSISTDFISGGLFSLDGVHLTPKGYAVVANQFIKAINQKYGVSIPLIDINAKNIRGVLFP